MCEMNRDFRLFWSGQVVSNLGSTLTMVAVPLVAVAHLDASAFQVGILSAAVMAPMFFFGIAIATWGDGLPHKRPFLIGADLVAAAGTLVLAGLLITGRLTIPLMIAGVFLLGVVRTFIETVYFVHLRGLVGEDELVRARARLEAGEQVGDVTGRAAVGPLVSWVSAAAPFVLDALTYVINAVCLRKLRTPEPRTEPQGGFGGEPFARRMWGGVVEIRRQPFLRGLVPYLLIAQLAAGAATALTAPFLLRVLGIPVALYGLLFVLLGIAGTLGALLSTSLAKREVDPRSMILWGFGLAALPVVALASAGGPLPVAAAVAAVGIGLPSLFAAIANVGLAGYATRVVPQEILGRAAMTLQVANTLPLIVGALLGGLLGDLIGVRPALVGAAAVAILAIGLLIPLGRRMRDEPQEPDQAEQAGGPPQPDQPKQAGGPPQPDEAPQPERAAADENSVPAMVGGER